ncbi:hypothetical protein [Luteibacter sp.]|jgi:hypothetical protein|uniref:hypothetical protein n=1 Tax=Luteibacter sp. TaxID=1886636 RepID=UPI003F8120B7
MRTIYQTVLVGFLFAVACGSAVAASAPVAGSAQPKTQPQSLDLPCNPLVCSVK